MRFESLLLPAFAGLVYACGGERGVADADTVLADSLARVDEAAVAYASWTPLAVGGTFAGWHKYGGGDVGSAWKAMPDGSIMFDPSVKEADGRVAGGGDIVTDGSYADYELELDWKIAPCGNSGVIYNVVEEPELEYPWLTGPEMQVLDNSCHPDAKVYKHKAGDLYDLLAGDSTVVRPAGEWNTARLVNQAGHVEHWLNGVKVVEYNNTGDNWRSMIAASKFKEMPRFGSATSGHIALQDHGDPVWYRNIRIREL